MNKLELKEFRKKYNLSVQDVADIVKLSVFAVKSWEDGVRDVSKSAVQLLNLYVANLSENGLESNLGQEPDAEYNVNEPVGKRLTEYAEYKGVSIKDFATKCGIGYNNATSLLKGTLPLGMHVLQKIKKAFPDLNTEWALYGNGDMEVNNKTANERVAIEIERLTQANGFLETIIKEKEKTINGLDKQIALMEKLQEVTKTEESPIKSNVAG